MGAPDISFGTVAISLSKANGCIKKVYYGRHRGYGTFLNMDFQNSKLRFKKFPVYI